MENSSEPHYRRDATLLEVETLPHVVEPLPLIVWVALMIGAAERFTFYAVATPWQNYIQNDRDSVAIPGALGLGQSTATIVTNAFFFFSFLTPIPFAVVSDAWLGHYKTLVVSLLLNLCGCMILFVSSLPFVEAKSVNIIGLALSMILLGLGTGGVKARVSPFIGDQYTTMAPQLIVRKNGERVIANRTLTLQYIYNVAYWLTNIAALSLVAATYLEKDVGFWAAYLLALCAFWVSIPLLLFWTKSFVKTIPQGNVLPRAMKVMMYSSQHRFRLDAAMPAFQAETHGRQVAWDDQFVFEMRRGIKACQVMACFLPFYVCMSQMSNNLISQAGQMRLGFIPNDAIQALSGIACVILGPIVQKGLYPSLQKHGIAFKPIARMTCSFVAAGAAMACAAGVQKVIYSKGPCYEQPLHCPASVNGSFSNNISVWIQVPLYFLLAFAEITGYATLSEYSYSESPKDMRSLVQALRQVTSGIGSGLGIALSPLAKDPKILYLYTGLAVTMTLSAPTFWFSYREFDSDEKGAGERLQTLPNHNDEDEGGPASKES